MLNLKECMHYSNSRALLVHSVGKFVFKYCMFLDLRTKVIFLILSFYNFLNKYFKWNCLTSPITVSATWVHSFSFMSSLVNDESSRDAEVAAREHMGSSSSLQSREEKQEPVVVRPYPQVQMLSTHHAVASGTPVTVAAPPAHLTPAVPLSFSEGLMKVMERFKISHWTAAKDWLVFLTMLTKS